MKIKKKTFQNLIKKTRSKENRKTFLLSTHVLNFLNLYPRDGCLLSTKICFCFVFVFYLHINKVSAARFASAMAS